MSRKQWLIVKLILLILILFTILRIGIKVMTHSGSNYHWFGSSMTNDMPIENGEKKVFSDVEKILIDSINLPVEIYESDVNQVTIQDNTSVQGVGTRKANKISYQDGILSFKQAKQRPFLFSVRGNVVVEVPRGSNLEYRINSVSGHINHDALSKGQLKVGTVSGSINIYQEGKKVSAESISGSIQIDSAFEEIKVDTISASIRIVANQDTKEIKGSSVSGSIKVKLDKVPGYEMDYSTVSSRVRDSYAKIDYSKSGKAINGDGSLKIDAQSVSGSITLTDWE